MSIGRGGRRSPTLNPWGLDVFRFILANWAQSYRYVTKLGDNFTHKLFPNPYTTGKLSIYGTGSVRYWGMAYLALGM